MFRLAAAIPLLLASGCIIPDGTRPGTRIAATVESQHNHRGMPQTTRGSFEPELGLVTPTTTDGSLSGAVKGFMDLSNSTGDAWTPDGHAGKFQQIDFVAQYAHNIDALGVRGGIHNYNLPQGAEFEFGERGGTTELFTELSGEVLEAQPYVEARYDFDEVDDWYFRGGIRESFEFEGIEILLDGHLAYSTKGQSLWNYGIEIGGLADLKGSAEVRYRFGKNDEYWISGILSGSTIIDDDLRDWFDVIGIDSDNVWVGVMIGWAVDSSVVE